MQGDQVKFNPMKAVDQLKNVYAKNTAETRDLLNVEQSPLEMNLQRLYFSSNCQYFYLALMVTSVILMLVTIFEGLLVNNNPVFFLVEVAINLLILGDFLTRVWLTGLKRFFKRNQLWNYFDALVVLGCVLLFLAILLNKQMNLLLLEELSEEVLLIVWSVFQTLRMIFIAKK